ncbi:MAG: hypothetical protein AB1791_13740 [Chloroflexota bacterium]
MSENFELKISFVVLLFLTGVYVVYEVMTIPAGGHPFGHALGILGSILMVMTETLYSARKRLAFVRFGRVRHWLSLHIFTGIVGPVLVLMHTGLEFRGLAGFTTLLTAIVVASGFLGRYIYTAVPRTLAGVEVDRLALEEELARQRAALAAWAADKPNRIQLLVQKEVAATAVTGDLPIRDVLARRFEEWREQRRIQTAVRQLEREEQTRLAEIERGLRQQQRLVRQIRSLQTVHRLMGLWHTAHIPLGLTLFAAMIIHIVATIYYGSLF